jgi:hypothetical protein
MKLIVVAVLLATLGGCAIVPIAPPGVYVGAGVDSGYYYGHPGYGRPYYGPYGRRW